MVFVHLVPPRVPLEVTWPVSVQALELPTLPVVPHVVMVEPLISALLVSTLMALPVMELDLLIPNTVLLVSKTRTVTLQEPPSPLLLSLIAVLVTLASL